MGERARLAGGPERTASWAYMREDGSLVVECYDYGAEEMMGTDVAFFAVVAPEHLGDLRARLDCDVAGLPGEVAARFESYFAFKAWLAAEGIPFRSEFDGWA